MATNGKITKKMVKDKMVDILANAQDWECYQYLTKSDVVIQKLPANKSSPAKLALYVMNERRKGSRFAESDKFAEVLEALNDPLTIQIGKLLSEINGSESPAASVKKLEF